MKEQFYNINFEITHNCNQKCKYCYNSPNSEKSLSDNPLSALSRLFDIADLKQLTITGGEPTLSDYLIECVVHARLNNTKVVMITNASSQKQSIFKDAISAGVSHFQVTINSSEYSIHDNLALTKGAFKRTIKNIEYIMANGGKVIPSIVLTDQNSSTIKKTFELFSNYDLKNIIVNRYNLSAGDYSKQLIMDTISLKKCFRQIDDIAREKGLIITSNVCTPFCIINPNDYANIHFGKCPDDPKQKPITVDFNGNMRLCNHSPKIIGNIFKDTFPEMLYSDYALSWISSIPEFCINCYEYEDCKGGCKAASEQINNNHLLVDPLIEMNNVQRTFGYSLYYVQ